MADADSSGNALNAQWSALEYTDALNFAIGFLHSRMLIPTAADLTWVQDQFDYTVPGNLVYLSDIWAESNAALFSPVYPAVGSGLFEYTISLDVVSVKRDSTGALMLHFDKQEVARQFLNQAGLKVRLSGYMYQQELVNGTDILYLNWPEVLLLAKQYMHLTAAGRDPNDLMRHLRQWQAVGTQISANIDDSYEKPGGIWLDK